MNRRNALKSIAALLIFVLSFTMIGCPAQKTIADLIGIAGNSAANVAQLEGNTDAATAIHNATTVAVGLATNWKSGDPAGDVVAAVDAVEAAISLIPGTSKYAPLVDLALGTLEAVIETLAQGSPTPTAAHGSVPHRQVRLTAPPHDAGAFKKQWGAIIKQNPELAAAKI